MNFRLVFHQLGNLLKVEAALMVLPLVVSFIYHDNNYMAFIAPIVLLLVCGFLLTLRKDIDKNIYAKEGFAIVGLSWLLISLFGSIPFLMSGAIPNFIDAFFETVSGFTTTGASILNNVEILDQSILFWRSLTHWIGGMGILVFVIALLPQTNARNMFIIKAESPGPIVGKIVSRVKHTARILYAIYFVLTLVLIGLLSIKMPLFDSINHALATAGTGGFSIKNASIAYYNNAYIETVITIFMILFGINFTVFYLALVGNINKALKSEELHWFLFFIFGAIALIVANTLQIYETFGETLRHSAFQVASIISTTGFATVDFNSWPTMSKLVLLFLMFIGSCAGSTGGGIKVSRVVIYLKMIIKEIRYSIHPRQVYSVSFEKKPVDDIISKDIFSFLTAYLGILVIATLIISIEGKDLITTVSSVIACFNNVGPGFGIVGPMGNFSSLTNLSKITLIFTMLAGRLEIFPILILFSPKLWRQH